MDQTISTELLSSDMRVTIREILLRLFLDTSNASRCNEMCASRNLFDDWIWGHFEWKKNHNTYCIQFECIPDLEIVSLLNL